MINIVKMEISTPQFKSSYRVAMMGFLHPDPHFSHDLHHL